VKEQLSDCPRCSGTHRLPGIRFAAGIVGLAIAALLMPACGIQQPVGGARPSADEARGEDLLQQGDAAAALVAFRRMAETARTPEERARAQVGIARSHLKLANYRSALDALYAARSSCDLGPIRTTLDRLFGEASFLNGDYGIARSYLEKSLATTSGADRSRILAQLYLCARRTSDPKAAERYLAEIPKPLSREIRDLIGGGTESRPPVQRAQTPQVARKTPQAPAVREEEVPGIGPIQVIPRGSWGARPVIMARIDPMGKIFRLTIHHTGGPTFWGHSVSETAYEIRKIQRFHQGENHWADIGYHYIVDRVGRVWQGRPLNYQGAHAHGTANRGNIGVVVLGNYAQQGLNTAQIRTLRNLIYELSSEYAIPPSRIYTHGEIRHGLTDCPGPAVAHVVEDIRRGMGTGRHAD
jgi:hypothetical protein